jgi:hypothetical protein
VYRNGISSEELFPEDVQHRFIYGSFMKMSVDQTTDQ